MFCLPFRERSGASPGLQRCGWRSEVCQLPVETARHASVLLLAPSLRYSPVSSVSFAKFKMPAVMTGHRGKYQNSPNQKCSFRPTTVKIYTSDFLHWQDWKSSNSILSTLHVGCSVDSLRKLNLKSEFNWSWRDLFLQTVIMSQFVGSERTFSSLTHSVNKNQFYKLTNMWKHLCKDFIMLKSLEIEIAV